MFVFACILFAVTARREDNMRSLPWLTALVLSLLSSAVAQQSPVSKPADNPDKPRVFITDSH
jgi:hypothetical protein